MKVFLNALIALLAVLVFEMGLRAAPSPELVKDIFATYDNGSSTPGNFCVVGDVLFFTAAQPWGTLNDIVLFFTATDTSHGTELWKSDGTVAGTVIACDVEPGSASSTPRNLTAIGNVLFFQAVRPDSGLEVWKSDGTAAGTVLVRDIMPGPAASFPSGFVAMNGIAYFGAADSLGFELWKSDGTEAGTTMVKDIRPGESSGLVASESMRAIGNTLYFVAGEPGTGLELWKTDGTEAGTVLVRDLEAGSGSSNPSVLTPMNGALYFLTTETTELGLWKTDGTEAGTTRVTGIGSFETTPLVAIGSSLYFRAFRSSTGTELYKTNGLVGGTLLVKDVTAGTTSEPLEQFTVVGSTLYFVLAASHSRSIWKRATAFA